MADRNRFVIPLTDVNNIPQSVNEYQTYLEQRNAEHNLTSTIEELQQVVKSASPEDKDIIELNYYVNSIKLILDGQPYIDQTGFAGDSTFNDFFLIKVALHALQNLNHTTMINVVDALTNCGSLNMEACLRFNEQLTNEIRLCLLKFIYNPDLN